MEGHEGRLHLDGNRSDPPAYRGSSRLLVGIEPTKEALEFALGLFFSEPTTKETQMGRHIPDNTDAAAQAADDACSERGLEPEYDPADEPDIPTHVEIFAGTGCSYCTKAKELCEARGLPYTYKNMDDDEEAFFQLHGRIKKWETVPQIFVGPIHVKYLGD